MTDTGTTTRSTLARIYRNRADYTHLYVDLSVDTADPPGVLEERRSQRTRCAEQMVGWPECKLADEFVSKTQQWTGLISCGWRLNRKN